MADIMNFVIIAILPLAAVVGYFIFSGRKRDEKRAFLEAGWIYPSITLSSGLGNSAETKSALQPYADELGWKIGETAQASGRAVDLRLAPEKSGISPKEFASIQGRAAEISFAILRDLVFKNDAEKAGKGMAVYKSLNMAGVKEGQSPGFGNFIYRQKTGLLTIVCVLGNRIRMEKLDPEGARAIFGAPLEQDLREILGAERLAAQEKDLHERSERLILGIREKMAGNSDADEIDKAEIAMQNIRNMEKEQNADERRRIETLRKMIWRVYDIEIK